jgi:hypothetical protein
MSGIPTNTIVRSSAMISCAKANTTSHATDRDGAGRRGHGSPFPLSAGTHAMRSPASRALHDARHQWDHEHHGGLTSMSSVRFQTTCGTGMRTEPRTAPVSVQPQSIETIKATTAAYKMTPSTVIQRCGSR